MAEVDEKSVEKKIIQVAGREIDQVTKGDFQALKKSAQLFLDMIQEMFYVGHSILQKDLLINELITIKREMNNATRNTRKALELQHFFESQLNNFMGREIYLTYVTSTGDLNIYNNISVAKLYQKATKAHNRPRANISASYMFDAKQIDDDLREKLQRSIRNKRQVFQQAIHRWEKNKEEQYSPQEVESGKQYYPSKGTYYWRLHDYHITGWTDPINRGHIAEGYVDAVLHNDRAIDAVGTSLKMEWALHDLWAYHINKNNIPAIVKGDVVWKENGDIQFAVKTGNFSTASFNQYVITAYIVTLIETLTIEELQNLLPHIADFSKVTKQIIKRAQQQERDRIIIQMEGNKTVTITLGK